MVNRPFSVKLRVAVVVLPIVTDAGFVDATDKISLVACAPVPSAEAVVVVLKAAATSLSSPPFSPVLVVVVAAAAGLVATDAAVAETPAAVVVVFATVVVVGCAAAGQSTSARAYTHNLTAVEGSHCIV